MTSRPRTKVRLVKCPKCSKILPEPEQVPLYTCGGCGTILQAKYYKAENRASGLDSHEQIATNINGIVRACDGGESSSSSQRSSSAGGQSSDQNQVEGHNVVEDHNSEQLGGANSKHFTSSSSSELGHPKNKGDAEVDINSQMSNANGHVVNQNEQHLRAASSANEASFTEGVTVLESDEQHDSFTVGNRKCIARANSPKEAFRLCGSQVIESNELLTLSQDHAAPENKEAQQIARVNGVTLDEDERLEDAHPIPSGNQKQVGDLSSLREASPLDDSLIIGAKETVQNGSDNQSLAESRKEHLEGELCHKKIPAENVDCHDMDKIPNLAEEESNGKGQDDSIDCIQEQLGSTKLSEAFVSTEITHGRDDSTAGREANSRASRDNRKMGSCSVSLDPQCGGNSLKNVTETLRQKTEDFDDGSAYGAESARSVRNPKASELVNAYREDGRSHKMVQRSPTKASLAYDGSVSSFDGKDDHGIEQQEHVPMAGNDLKNLVRRNAYSNLRLQSKTKTSSQILLDEKLKEGMLEEAGSVQENAIPLRMNGTRPNRDGFMPRVPPCRSSELFNETGSSSSYIHEDLPIHRMHHHPYRYEDSEAWFKKGYAQKQHMDPRRFPEALWRENEFASMYYNCETSGEIYHRSRYPAHVDRRRRAESWSLSGSLPRVHYSGEIFNGRYQMQDPYMNRHPADIRWSAQLPRPTAYCWDSYDSSPTSPRQFTEPESYPWPHDAASVCDNQRLRDQIMRRLQLREKRQGVKRHCRPFAGGAPFITCYFCFRVVQLPEEFLLSRRITIIHKVKCGACSSILEFSLENETGLYPRIPEDATEGADTNIGRNNSTEIRSRNSRNDKKLEEYHRAGGRSHSRQTKVKWQLPSRSKSPLHRLMGYPSPHDVFSGHEGKDVDW